MTFRTVGESFNPDVLADKIIDAFQHRSFDTYKKLLLDATDYKEFLNELFSNNQMAEAQRKQFAERERTFAESSIVEFQKEFDRLLSKGVNIGVDWTLIRKAKFVINEDIPGNDENKSLTGHLNFTCKNTTYVFFGIKAMQFSSGYKILSIRSILKGGIEQYVDPDLLDDEDM